MSRREKRMGGGVRKRKNEEEMEEKLDEDRDKEEK